MKKANCKVSTLCVHTEVFPGGVVSPVPHRFEAVTSATPSPLIVDGGGPILEGDGFRNNAVPDHQQPQAGRSFAQGLPTQCGKHDQAGQSTVVVDGKPAVTLAGRIEICSEGLRVLPNTSGVTMTKQPLLSINGMPVLTGR